VTFAAYESEHKSDRIRAKMREIATAGGWKGGPRPFGWDSDGMTERQEEVDVLREAKDRVLAGETLRSVASNLVARGIRGARGAAISTTALRKALLAPRVIGKYATKRGEIIGDGRWEPIFDESEWTRLRLILTDPARRTNGGRTARKYLLAGGLARCGLCSTALVARPRRGPYKRDYYGCVNDPANGRSGCGKVHIQVADLDSLIVEATLARLDSPDYLSALREAGGHGAPEAAEAMAEAARLEARLEELADGYGREEVTFAEWMAAKKPLQARRDAARDRVRSAELDHYTADVLAGAATLRSSWTELPLDRRRAVLTALLEAVVVNPHTGGRKFNPARVAPAWRI